MKKTSFRLILAALVATAALTACTKEVAPPNFENDKVEAATEGTRVITVSFAPQTKTYLEGLQPKFDNKDSILLVTVPDDPMAEVDTQTVAVTIDPTTQNATISTRLFGDLKALYPAQKAEKVKGTFDILVSAEQSGKFEDANICQAEISSGSNTAQFTNMYALFKIKSPDAPQSLTIKSLSTIGTDGQRTGTRKLINGDGAYSVTVSTPILTMPDSTYYVAIIQGVNLSDLSFEVEYWNEGTGAVKGIPTSVIQAQAAVLGKEYDAYNEVKPGTAYTIDDTNWHEYVTVASRKWATTNIGAVSETDAGEYFAWGGTTGYVSTLPNGDWYSFSPPDSTLLEGGFCWATCPHTQDVYTDSLKSVFTKYTADNSEFANSGIADDKTILDLEDDAAYVKWGGAWRMPNQDEFSAMILNCKGEFNSGQYFGDNDSSPQIFLPAAGCGNGGNNPGNKTELRYWSSTLGPFNFRETAYSLFEDSEGQPTCCEYPERYYGYTIRAIIDDGYIPAPAEE